MGSTVMVVYAMASVATAVVAFVVSRRVARFTPSVAVRVVTSLIAGALWPIVLIGIVQAGCVVLYVRYAKPRKLATEQYAEPVDARL